MPQPFKLQENRLGHSNSRPTAKLVPSNVSVPPVPQCLGEVGTELWHRVWNDEVGAYYQNSDMQVLERYCLISEQYYELMEIVKTEGAISNGSKGQEIIHPALRAADAMAAKLTTLEGVLIRTPESRIRLGLKAKEVESRLDAFRDQ